MVEYRGTRIPSIAFVAVTVRPSDVLACPSETVASMSWIREIPASTSAPATAQSLVVSWQSATKWRRLSSNPFACASAADCSSRVGSTAPSSTMRPVRAGKRWAYVAPISVPYEKPR